MQIPEGKSSGASYGNPCAKGYSGSIPLRKLVKTQTKGGAIVGTFHAVSREEFEGAIFPLGFRRIPQENLGTTREFVYGKRMDCGGAAFTVRIYSGIDTRSNASREVGSDAIRVCMIGRNSDGSIYGVCKDRRVNRTKNWALNLRDRLSHFGCDSVQTCPKCNAPMALRQGRNGDFYGCSEFRTKGCNGSRNA